MVRFQGLGLVAALGLVALLAMPEGAALAASPTIVIPPRNNNGPVQCDSRGCFGFGRQQWYRRPGAVLPNYPPSLNRRNRYDNPRIYIQPRVDTTLPKPAIRSPLDNRSRHQSWCVQHYRTYNPGTNMYTSLHNGFQVCRSPWG
jgi:hypothetical protein